MNEKLYKTRNIDELGEYYTKHYDAILTESLIGRPRIAAELAVRDKAIVELTAALNTLIKEPT